MDILDKVVAGQGEEYSDLDYLHETGQGRWRNLSRNIDLSDHRYGGPPLATPSSRVTLRSRSPCGAEYHYYYQRFVFSLYLMAASFLPVLSTPDIEQATQVSLRRKSSTSSLILG